MEKKKTGERHGVRNDNRGENPQTSRQNGYVGAEKDILA